MTFCNIIKKTFIKFKFYYKIFKHDSQNLILLKYEIFIEFEMNPWVL